MPVFTPLSISGLEFWGPCAWAPHVYVESNTSPMVTHATDNGQLVGGIDDPSGNAHRMVCGGDTFRPTYDTSDALARHALLTFAATKNLNVENSLNAFTFLHSGTPTGCIACFAKPGSDGTLMVLFDSCQYTGAKVGLTIAKTAANKINVWGGNGTNSFVNFLSAGTVTAAGGVVPIIVNLNGASSQLFIGGAAAENFSMGSASTTGTGGTAGQFAPASGTAAWANLYWGSTSANGNAWVGSMGDPVILSAPMGAGDRTSFAAWNPYPTYSTLAGPLAGGDALAANQLTHLNRWYSFDQALGGLWQLVTRATAVTTTGDPVGVLDHLGGQKLSRNAVAAANNNTRPTWAANLYNGKGAGAWVGTAQPQNLAYPAFPLGGDVTLFCVGQNSNTANGSHFLASASSYLVGTGSSYGGNAPPNGPGTAYGALHLTAGQAPIVGLANLPDGLNIFEIVRSGPKVRFFVNGFESAPVGNINQMNFNNMGTPKLANFDLTGWVPEVNLYTAAFTDVDRDRRRKGLAQTWGIANVAYPAISNNLRIFSGWGGGYDG
jgi:hypothetical protein